MEYISAAEAIEIAKKANQKIVDENIERIMKGILTVARNGQNFAEYSFRNNENDLTMTMVTEKLENLGYRVRYVSNDLMLVISW